MYVLKKEDIQFFAIENPSKTRKGFGKISIPFLLPNGVEVKIQSVFNVMDGRNGYFIQWPSERPLENSEKKFWNKLVSISNNDKEISGIMQAQMLDWYYEWEDNHPSKDLIKELKTTDILSDNSSSDDSIPSNENSNLATNELPKRKSFAWKTGIVTPIKIG